MLDTIHHAPLHRGAAVPPAAYRGPERRAPRRQSHGWLMAMLDEIDYPMLLLGAELELVHANRSAACELDAQHPLQLLGGILRARRSADVAPLHDALAAAQSRGLRRLISLGETGAGRVSVAIIPLPRGADDDVPPTLLVFGRRQLCETLTVDWFALEHSLTPAEAQVLKRLCAGLRPQEIARDHGVALSTVRSQVGSIRAKTAAASIRELVSQVSMMPPLVGILGRAAAPVLRSCMS